MRFKAVMYRGIAGLLLSALLLASCGDTAAPAIDTADTGVTENTTTAPETEPTHDANGYLLDDIPDTLDYNGKTVTILTWNHYEPIEFYATEQSGEIVNDAYHTRNLHVEERLKVKLAFKEANGRYRQNDFADTVINAVAAGTGDYDLTAGYSLGVAGLVLNGVYNNLLKVEHLDFTKPWWSQQMVDSITIADTLFFTTGDICSSSISRMQGIFFNADMIKEHNLENPYTLTVDGKWTIDKMFTMSKGMYKDLNANNTKDEADRFGFTVDRTQLQPTFFTSGMRAVETDASGKLVLSKLLAGERAVNVLNKFATFLHTSSDAIIVAKTDDNSTFYEGRALFHAFPLAIITNENIRSAKFNYGFVPWPKLNEEDNHVIIHSNAFTLWSIPKGVSDVSMSGALMETMASEGHRTIAPALFETAYKVKYNTDSSSLQSRIFDEMRAGILVDVGRVFANVLPYSISKFANMIVENADTWVSSIESNRSAFNQTLTDIYEACKKNA